MKKNTLLNFVSKGALVAVLVGAGLFAALLSGASTGASAQGAATVTMFKDAFTPQTLTVPVGTTVLWLNGDYHYHSVTSDTGMFDSGTMYQNNSYQYMFSLPGTYYYHDRFLGGNMSGMWGVIIVTGGDGYVVPAYNAATSYVAPVTSSYSPTVYATTPAYTATTVAGYTPVAASYPYSYSGYSYPGYTPVTSGSTYYTPTYGSYAYPYSAPSAYAATSVYSPYAVGYTPVTSSYAQTYGYAGTSGTSVYYPTQVAQTYAGTTYGTGYGSSYVYPYTSVAAPYTSSRTWRHHSGTTSTGSNFSLNCAASTSYSNSYMCQMGW